LRAKVLRIAARSTDVEKKERCLIVALHLVVMVGDWPHVDHQRRGVDLANGKQMVRLPLLKQPSPTIFIEHYVGGSLKAAASHQRSDTAHERRPR
jgi:hypothetical protein